ncbi:MAG: TAXI family TRAP transporter solute-binding subunit [Planctomycetota bacterium]|jgi:TRAP transporter TAXI family solute receptor
MSAPPGTPKETKDREGMKIGVIVTIIAVIGFVVTWQFVGPSVPDTITLATGSETGAYHAFGQRYREALEPYGIEVELRATAGSLENVELLASGEVDIAFVQGGTVPPHHLENVEGIASLYYEPLWVFVHAGGRMEKLGDLVGAGPGIEQFGDLAGKRVQIGGEGSGTRAVALELLEANGVNEENSELLGMPTGEAIDALLAGEIDAVCLVAGAGSGSVQRLMAAEGDAVTLFDVPRGLAYERTFRHLREVVLAEGVLDPANNVPDRDIHMMSPTAGLLTTEGLHEALAPLLIDSAREIHGKGDVFEKTNEFPAEGPLDVPLSLSAKRYFEKGPSFLYRVLPFAVAATLDRLMILLLPLLTLLFPLFKIAPPLYRWRIRSKIYRWYRVLYEVEHEMDDAADDADAAPFLQKLAEVEQEIHGVKVPPSYMEELYNLRMHLARVQVELRARPE